MIEPVPADFYDADYFTTGEKSNYQPYGPGSWADWLAAMIHEYLAPESVLDVGCARGYVVKRLQQRGVQAHGFDISEWAVAHSEAPGETWVGRAEDPASYRVQDLDLVVATELAEHLVPSQARAFLRAIHGASRRALLLIAMGEPHEGEKDLSHVNIQLPEWWEQEARAAGWVIGDASSFNKDDRSVQMSWSGRFMYLVKEDS